MRSFRLIAILGVALGLAISPGTAAAQVRILPGSVAGGQSVLENKGCLTCHALNKRGGTRAPDFAELPGQGITPARLATEMWNHGPRMWSEFQASNRPIPALTSIEAADLFAYFYAALYFEPAGDAGKGRTLFEDKRCASCHSDALDSRTLDKSVVHRWLAPRDPIGWAEQMWNHASEMNSAMAKRGIKWPELSGQDIVHITTFLASLSAPDGSAARLSMGDPQLGRGAFERSCESCHTLGQSAKGKVNLLASSKPLTVTGFIGAMWNHTPTMLQRGAADTTKLRNGEMGDVMAFLFSQQYFFERGNIDKGTKVYENKGCASCHEGTPRLAGAADLTQSPETYSPITLTAVLWRHGPSMQTVMTQRKIAWPQFQGSEMTDLIAYLNSRLVTRLAR